MDTDMNIGAELKKHLNEIIVELYGQDVADMTIEHPANEKFGDYASNAALILSKKLKQSPLEIANNIVSRLRTISQNDARFAHFKEISSVAPGFINFKLSEIWLNNVLIAIYNQGNNYGNDTIGIGKRIALEHSNVNPNKAAHIGHLRNACIGQYLERVYETLGFSVDVQFYANNVGVQVATSNMGVQKNNTISPTSYKKFDHYAWDIYAAMETMIGEHPDLGEERMKMMEQLEDPESIVSKTQKELATKILIEQLKTFQNLGFDYDVIIFESDILNLHMWEKAFEALKNNVNVYFATEGSSKGCWLVKMQDEPSPVTNNDSSQPDIEKDKIIVRSNGIATYTGKDIAYHMWKYGLLGIDFGYKKWDIGTQTKPLWITTSNKEESAPNISFSGVDYVYDVIGTEQTYAMGVVKQSLSYLGFDNQAQHMKHVNYGYVYLSRGTAAKLGIDVSDGKKFYEMKGRKGWGVKIDDFIDLIDAELKEKYGDFEYISAVRNAAIKLQILKINTFQDLVFDLDDALDLKGYSGPYLQYTFVRTNSLLKKSAVDIASLNKDYSNYATGEYETNLLRWLYRFPEIVKKSADEFAPNMLSDYLFDVCRRYNAFYNNDAILTAATPEAKDFRLLLTYVVGIVLKKGLWILGIDSPEKM
jgi:arginyl-tRNA synthetase